MSLFYKNSRAVPAAKTVEVVEDLDAALVAASNREYDHKVAAEGGISVDRAQRLMREANAIELPLLAAINDGTVKTKSEAIAFVQEKLPDFPAEKFVAIIQGNLDRVNYRENGVDEDGNPIMEAVPVKATWAETVVEAKAEAAAVTAVAIKDTPVDVGVIKEG